MSKKYLLNLAKSPESEQGRRVISSPPLEIQLSRSTNHFECFQLKEPDLVFGGNYRCVDPKTGLGAYGPFTETGGEKKRQLRVGIVGTSEATEKVLSLLDELSRPVQQNPGSDSILHPAFPGLNSGSPFSSDLVTKSSWLRSVSPQAMGRVQDCGDPIAKFEMLRELFGERVRELSALEFAPNLAICAMPERVGYYLLKAACSQFLPTEILCGGHLPGHEGPQEDRSTQAWDFSVRLLYKSGVCPWRLDDATEDSCFVGISLHRVSESESGNTWTAFARLVTELDHGFVLKGDTFEWTPEHAEETTPYLDTWQAAKLMSCALEEYKKRVGRAVRKVTVHKISPYNTAEREGFEDSLRGVKQHAVVSVNRSRVFFLRPGRKPLSRGSAIPFGEKLGLVYTSGYVPFLRCDPGNGVPLPLEITGNWGSLTFQDTARDLLRLTKLNWNTSAFSSEFPVSLTFPNQVREMLCVLKQEAYILDDRFSL
jgi:hypothetical protein